MLKHEDHTRFIVLSRARTGSNLLISLLDSHPNIDAEGEILKRLGGRDPSEVIAQTFAAQPFFTKAKGFKIFYYHPLDGCSEQVWDYLASHREVAVIHLRRRNILRTIVSREIAERRHEWLTRTNDCPPVSDAEPFTLPPVELERAFRQTRSWEEEGDRRFVDHLTLPVWYEDVVGDLQSTFATMTDFLGVRYVRPRTELRRQNLEPLRELLVNHDELRSVFSGTEWETFFDD